MATCQSRWRKKKKYTISIRVKRIAHQGISHTQNLGIEKALVPSSTPILVIMGKCPTYLLGKEVVAY